uniref:Uncharacterized protein n=1 Tax=Rhizophora mucronata TaxID=61149 RepID=A0A2P2Q2G4_RHIMU
MPLSRVTVNVSRSQILHFYIRISGE